MTREPKTEDQRPRTTTAAVGQGPHLGEEGRPAPVPNRRSRVGSRPGHITEETPRELRPEPPPSRGSSYEAALQLLRCLNLGTSPISWSGSGDRLSPFGLGTPPEGARSNPASKTVAGFFGRHRIASMTYAMYDSSPARCKPRGSQDFASQSNFSRTRFSSRNRPPPD